MYHLLYWFGAESVSMMDSALFVHKKKGVVMQMTKILKAGNFVRITDIRFIDKTIMDWRNGDVLQIKEVDESTNTILVYDREKKLAEYIFDYEFDGLEIINSPTRVIE